MDDANRNQFRRLLESVANELRSQLKQSAEASAPVSPDNAIGRLTRQDAMQAQQMALEMRRRNRARLNQVELALKRLEGNEFGLCGRCEEEISPARLRVKPESELCVRCASAR